MEVTPEQVAQFKEFLANGMKLVHSEKTRDMVLDRVKADSDKVKGVADVTLQVIRRLEAGREVDDLVKLDAGNVLMGQIMEVVEAAGIHKYTDEEKQNAYAYAIQQYTKEGMGKGKYDQAELEQIVQQSEAQELGGDGDMDQAGPEMPMQQKGLLAGGV